MIQILIPISGSSSFFPKSEYYFPKPLVEVCGKPMIEIVVSHLKSHFPDSTFTFVVDPEDTISFSLDKTLQLLTSSDSTIVEKHGSTSGALCSCMLAIDHLDPDEPLLIVNSDQFIDYDLKLAINTFIDRGSDAGVLTFDSIHPRWSYVLTDQDCTVLQTFEKRVASRNAIAGLYFYNKSSTFFDAASKVILNDVQIDGSFFVSSSLNEVILSNGLVSNIEIPPSAYHSFYSPSKIDEFERIYSNDHDSPLLCSPALNIVIPAAGLGSRFSNQGWKKPKPFIDVDGQPMLNHVINNVSSVNSSTTLILNESHIKSFPLSVQGLSSQVDNIISLDKLTEGTACTVLAARSYINNNNPLLIANSDQYVEFDVDDFLNDCFSRGLDGSILVFRDPTLNPKWSFARVSENGLVQEVAEKKPISDLATVGIYLFSSGSSFISSAIDMIISNDRVNNEFYTCPVYNYMIKKGARIGVYEIPMSAMHGLGTPEDLNKFLSIKSFPSSADSPDL